MRLDPRRLFQRWFARGVAAAGPPVAKPPGAGVVAVRIPATHQMAAERLVDKWVVQGSPYARRINHEPWDGLREEIRDFAEAFLRELRKRGMPFFLHSGLRSRDEQNALWKKGVTRARAGQSPHNYGLAVDIVHFGRFWNLNEREWAVIGLIGKEVARKRGIKIVWGGDFSSLYDPAHWEIADWREKKATP